jgi:hypothetical protein
MKREEVYKLIDGERDYQDGKWNPTTTVSGGKHQSPEEWITYMEDYLAEAKHLVSREAHQISYPKAMDIIRKVTALGVAAMEQIETSPRKV